MKCPVCQELGLRSKVMVGGSAITLMGFTPYYDEDGVYHSHDPNVITEGYGCSRSHDWRVKRRASCPAPDCTYPDEEPKLIIDNNFGEES